MPVVNGDTWRWIAGVLLTLVAFLFGLVLQPLMAGGIVTQRELLAHEEMPAHPVGQERLLRIEKSITEKLQELTVKVAALQDQVQDVKDRLARIEETLRSSR